jgi:hypothetical protein
VDDLAQRTFIGAPRHPRTDMGGRPGVRCGEAVVSRGRGGPACGTYTPGDWTVQDGLACDA